MASKIWLSPTARRLAEAFDGDAEQGIVHRVRHLLRKSKVKAPPFYPDLLTRCCGIDEILQKGIRQDGLLLRNGQSFSICVNRRYPVRSPQWNAICAHEIGHALLLAGGEVAHGWSAPWTDEEEYLADLAARELLLPMRTFRPLAESGDSSGEGFSIESLTRFSDIFRAPPRMTATRLVETRLWKGLVLLWRPVRNDPDRIVLKWRYSNEQAAEMRRLKVGLSPSAAFGKNNRIDQAWVEKTPTRGLEMFNSKNRFTGWFVRSGSFEEHGASYLISLVRLE